MRSAAWLVVLVVGCGGGIGAAEKPPRLAAKQAAAKQAATKPTATVSAPAPAEPAAAAPGAATPGGPLATVCEKASRIAPKGLPHLADRYDPQDYISRCRANLASPQGEQWAVFYECIVDAGDASWLDRCTKKSPGRG